MGTGEGKCGQGSGPGLPLGAQHPFHPSSPCPGKAQRPPSTPQPLCPGPQHPSSCLPSILFPLLSQAPSSALGSSSPSSHPPQVRVVIPGAPPSPKLSPVSGNIPFPSPAQVPSASSMQPATTLDANSIYPPRCARLSHTHSSTRCFPSLDPYTLSALVACLPHQTDYCHPFPREGSLPA